MTAALALVAILVLASAGWAAPPSVVGTNNNSDFGGSHPSYTANLPASVASGDLLIVCLSADSGVTSVTWPGGWSELYDADEGSVVGACGYRHATGGETTVTITAAGTADDVEFVSYRITGHDTGAAPEAGTPVTQASTGGPDPPSLSPSWGSAETLWIVVASLSQSTSPVTADPTNYGNRIEQAGGSANAAIASSRRTATTATEDPGAYTLSGTSDAVSGTVGVRPAAASAACPGRLMMTGIGGC